MFDLEYTKELERELVEPELYKFDGIYHYRGQENSQTGEILIDKNMKIVGEIRDPNSMCPRHAVKGEILIEDKLVRMNFVKIPSGQLLVPIYYNLGKLNEGNIIGEYEGIWAFHDKGIIFTIGYKPGIGAAVMVEHPEQSNKASLTLHKK